MFSTRVGQVKNFRRPGRRCRVSTIKDVAAELNLNWHTVKELDRHYLRDQPTAVSPIVRGARGCGASKQARVGG